VKIRWAIVVLMFALAWGGGGFAQQASHSGTPDASGDSSIASREDAPAAETSQQETDMLALPEPGPGSAFGLAFGGVAGGAAEGSANGSATNYSSAAADGTSEADGTVLPVSGGQWEATALGSSLANDASQAAGGSGDGEADLANGRTGGDNPSSAAGLSYGGVAPTQNATLLDGLSSEQSYFSLPRGFGGRSSTEGGPVTGASFAQGAVRSFRVMPATFSAQFGGGSSALLSIATRAGADVWHGAAFASLRSSVLDATNPFAIVTHYRDGVVSAYAVKPDDTLVQLGGHLSVPFAKLLQGLDHGRSSARGSSINAFLSWEEMLRSNPAISSPELASFYTLTATQTALLGNRGVSAPAINAALDYLDSLTGTVPRFSTRGLGFARVDQELRRDHLTGTYARSRFALPAQAGFSSASASVISQGAASVGDSFVDVDAGAAHWLHAITPNLRSILRLQIVRDLEYSRPRTPLAQEPAISPGGYAPEVQIAPHGFTYGTPTNLGRTAYPDEHRLQAVAQLDWIRGHHLTTVGFDWSRISDGIASFPNADGRFLYDSGVINGRDGGLVDWITDYTFNVNAYPNGGCPSIHAAVHDFCFRSFTQSFGAQQTQFVTHNLAGYFEQAWRPGSTLSLTAGVRWEYILLPFPQQPNRELDEGVSFLRTPAIGLTSSFPEDRNDFAPRVGVAWAPRGGSLATVRLGYGWFFGRLAGTTVRSALADTALPGSVLQAKIRPTTEVSCPQGGAVAGQGFGYPCAFETSPPVAVVQTSAAMLFARNFRLPAVQRATLSLERNAGQHVFVRATYAMAIATQLPGSTDINVSPSTVLQNFVLQGGGGRSGLVNGETFVVPLYTQRPLTAYGPVTALLSDANATFHSGTLEVELKNWNGLAARGSYTFSRSIDYAPQVSGTPQVSSQFDPFSNGYDKGLSTLNFPQRFAGDLVWRVTLRSGPAWLRRSVDGWRLSSIATAGSGAPYSYEISGGTYLAGGDETINGSGGATYLPTVGRNTLRLAVRGNVDAKAEREFKGPRGVRFSGFIESFNLLNERNLTHVETRAFLPGTAVNGVIPLVFQDAATIAAEGLTTPAFGQAISSTSGVSRERQMELGFRVEF
jgi:hypothetical protein